MARLARGGLSAALILFLVLSLVSPALAGDWTEFGGGPERLHRSGEQLSVSTAPQDWIMIPYVGVSRSQPIVIGDKLYHLGANEGNVPGYDPSLPWGWGSGAKAGAYLHEFDLGKLRELQDAWKAGSSPDAERALWTEALQERDNPVARINADPKDLRPSEGHVTYDPGTGGYYWGTADGCLAAWKPGMSEPVFQALYRERPGDIRVVSAPLLLAADVVAVGTSQGGVCVVKGLLTAQRSTVMGTWLPGSVTSSFARLSDRRFLTGVDGIGGHGEVRCYLWGPNGLSLFTQWGNNGRLLTPAGVPASFAVEGGDFYFSDKYGTFYKGRLADGKIVWSRKFGGIPATMWIPGNPAESQEGLALPFLYQYGGQARVLDGGRLFINASPALGDDLVYYTVRTTDRGASEWNMGAVMALRKSDGSLAWATQIWGSGNTCPLYWGHANRVLVGSDLGYVLCLDARTGMPRSLVQEEAAGGPVPVAGWVTTRQGRVEKGKKWEQVAGAAVELTLAGGYLIVGGNEKVGGVPTGHLALVRLGPAVNLTLDNASVTPSPAKPGQDVQVKCRVKLAEGQKDEKTWVGWRWEGEKDWRKVPGAEDLVLKPGEERWLAFPVKAPSQAQTVECCVNPDGLSPAYERDFGDNMGEALIDVVQPAKPLDIAVSMTYPLKMWTGMRLVVWVNVWVEQGPAVTTDVVFSVNGKSAKKTVKLADGKAGERGMVRPEFYIEAFEEGTLHLKAVANPRHDPPESRYDNNVCEVDVPVLYWSQGRKGTGIHVYLTE